MKIILLNKTWVGLPKNVNSMALCTSIHQCVSILALAFSSLQNKTAFKGVPAESCLSTCAGSFIFYLNNIKHLCRIWQKLKLIIKTTTDNISNISCFHVIHGLMQEGNKLIILYIISILLFWFLIGSCKPVLWKGDFQWNGLITMAAWECACHLFV